MAVTRKKLLFGLIIFGILSCIILILKTTSFVQTENFKSTGISISSLYKASKELILNKETGKTENNKGGELLTTVEDDSSLLGDYRKYPCVPGIDPFPQSIWAKAGRCVRMFNDTLNQMEADTKCVSLRTRKGTTPVCIYDAVEDHFISKSFLTSGGWETGLVNVIMNLLEAHKDAEFLDLGCNIGAYTLSAAKLGFQTTAVDAVLENVQKLYKSVVLGKLQDKVTIIWNAISDDYSKVGLTKYKGNVGGTAIRNLTMNEGKITNSSITQTIKLDDLTPLFKGKRLVIKMDIETQEYNALKGADSFFESVDVLAIQMEINAHKNVPTGPKIIEYLGARNYKPFGDTKKQKILDPGNMKTWPGDVYFMKD